MGPKTVTKQVIEFPKWALVLMNNLCEIERKLKVHGDPGNATRNIDKIRETVRESLNVFYEDPIGEPFRDTRTDLEATISGDTTDNLVVAEVIKPIIRVGKSEYTQIVQKGIVVVRAAEGEPK